RGGVVADFLLLHHRGTVSKPGSRLPGCGEKFVELGCGGSVTGTVLVNTLIPHPASQRVLVSQPGNGVTAGPETVLVPELHQTTITQVVVYFHGRTSLQRKHRLPVRLPRCVVPEVSAEGAG